MGRAPCCDKANVKKGPWSTEEDAKLKDYIEKFGTGGNWIALPQKVGLKRCGKSCRLRWLNYLRPDITHGNFTDHEDNVIFTLYATIGSRWSIMAAQLPGRTDNDIKNYWNTKLKKKYMGWYQTKLPQSLVPPSTLSYQTIQSNGSYCSFKNTNNDAVFQSQASFSQTNHQDYKVSNKSTIYGGESSTSSSSEGSCNNNINGKEREFSTYNDEMVLHNYVHGGFEDGWFLKNANGCGAVDGSDEKEKASWEEHPLDFEQLISTYSYSYLIFDEN